MKTMETEQQRIEKEALEAADKFDIRGCGAHQGFYRGYIAGATGKATELKEAIRELISNMKSKNFYEDIIIEEVEKIINK